MLIERHRLSRGRRSASLGGTADREPVDVRFAVGKSDEYAAA